MAADQAEAAAAAAAEQHALAAAEAQHQQLAAELLLPADAAAGEGALAVADAFIPLLAEGEHAALEVPLVLDAAAPAAASEQLLQLAGGLGLQAEPVALAAAAVVAAGPMPAHLAVLQQLHALQHMEEQAALPAGADAGAAPAAPAGPNLPAEPGEGISVMQQAALTAAAAAAAAAAPPAEHAVLPPLCPSPSVELSLDGQLPSPA